MNFFLQPLEQFEIYVYGYFPYILKTIGAFFFTTEMGFFFTNSLLYLGLIFLSGYFFLVLPLVDRSFLPSTGFELLVEKAHFFIDDVLTEQVNDDADLEYFQPLYLSVFFFILICNFIGLTPYGFTVTAFLIKTFALSISFLIGLSLSGFINFQGDDFFALFVPRGVPRILVPLLMVIEIVSYISRAFSLGIRLFANMMSGHSLLNILAGFVIQLGKKGLIFAFFPFLIVLLIVFLEVGIAFLQSYVFVVLLCIYTNDAMHNAHESH